MSTTATASPVLHADQEHDGLRAVVILLLVVAFFVSYRLVNSLWQWDVLAPYRDYAVSLSCIGALPLALGITAVAEYWLKQVCTAAGTSP